jgi:hypothetical protein
VLFGRSLGRGLLVCVALVLTTVFGATAATAYWQATGTGLTTAATATLAPPTGVSVPSISASSVAVTWTASRGSLAPTGYYATRTTGGTTAPACESSPTSLITVVSCTDAAPVGTHSYNVTAVYSSWTAVSAPSNTVRAVSASKLAFTTEPSHSVAGAAITPAVAVTVQSSDGTAVPVADYQISLAISSGVGTLTGVRTASTNAGGVATFPGLSIDKSGQDFKLSAISTGLASATSAPFAVTAAAATRLVFTTGPVAGVASRKANLGKITIQRQDAFGNTVSAGKTPLTLRSSSAGAVFSASPGGTALTTLTVEDGSHSASFFYGDTKAGSPNITVSSGLASATQTETITAAAPAKLAFISPPVSAVASNAATSGKITVQSQDAYGNPAVAPAAGTALTLSSSSAGTKIFSAVQNGTVATPVKIDAGADSTAFYFGDTQAGSPTISVSSTGWGGDTQAQTVVASTPAKVKFGQQPTSRQKGQLFTPDVTALIVDEFGNRTASTATVSIAISTKPSDWSYGRLSGLVSVNAIGGLAAFSGLSIVGTDIRIVGTDIPVPYIDWVIRDVGGSGTGYRLQLTSGSFVSEPSEPFNITQ